MKSTLKNNHKLINKYILVFQDILGICSPRICFARPCTINKI